MDDYPWGNDPTNPNQVYAGIGISFGTGGYKANFHLGMSHSQGDFRGSYGFGATYHSDFYETGRSGWEFRNSFKVDYDDGRTGVGLGVNLWRGHGQMSEFDQRTGILSFRQDDFRFSYENDGTPFQYLGLVRKNNDSYRTAAARIGYRDFSLNMNLLTGRRDKESNQRERELPGGLKGIPVGRGQFGENYIHGHVEEIGPKYRYGGLTLNYRGMSAGVNSEWVRHTFQNRFAHGFMQHQRQFLMLSDDWKPVFNLSNQGFSEFTTWGQ